MITSTVTRIAVVRIPDDATPCANCQDYGPMGPPHRSSQHITATMADSGGGGRYDLVIDGSIHDIDWTAVAWPDGLEACVASLPAGVTAIGMRRNRSAG